MISAGIRQALAESDEERQLAGELYTINEGVVRDQIERIDAHFHPDRYAK